MSPDQVQTHTRTITILVNNRPAELQEDVVTGEMIKNAAGVPLDFKLYDPHGDEIANDKSVRIHEHERFTAISGQDVS